MFFYSVMAPFIDFFLTLQIFFYFFALKNIMNKDLISEFQIQDVTCRQLGYERGVSICCGAYGYLYAKGVIDKLECVGNETRLLNCTHHPPPGSCSQDYAAVACFNGTLPGNRGNLLCSGDVV